MPETITRAGLVGRSDSGGAPEAIPLTGVAVEAVITGLCARVVVAQRYVNTETRPIEAVYVFPLDEGAAVCGFEAVIGDTLVVGEVKEREEAFRIYDDAMERGDGAFLLDRERPDVFQASVGRLPPGGEVLLRITYVAELSVDGNGLRFTIPTTVSPRYAPAADHTGVGRPDAETLNPPVRWDVPYGLDLSVALQMPGRIRRVESPSHPVSIAVDGQNAAVRLSARETALDRDFVLAVDADGVDAPRAWIDKGADGEATALAVGFVPTFDDAASPAEITFLVDRSGSMAGTSIEEVRNALQLCLRSLIPGCRFNIVGFGSRTESLFPESRAYDDESLAAATKYVSGLEADLGGTEILPALAQVLDHEPAPALTRQVVVLTDGEVTNTDAVLALAAKHAATARVFTFGIGAGASHHLVKGLARAGGGAAEFIYPGERIEPKVVRLVGRLLSRALTNVRVNWGGLGVTQAPAAVPPVFRGGRLLIYGFARSLRPATVTLSAEGPNGPISFAVAVDPSTAVSGTPVATLAACARIRELEESPAWIATRGSLQRARRRERTAAEIIDLSLRYNVISRETSFVAVERRDVPVDGEVELRRVPIALTHRWGGAEPRAKVLLKTRADGPIHSAFGRAGAIFSGILRRLPSAASSHDDLEVQAGQDLFAAELRSPSEQPAIQRYGGRLHALIELQRAEGFWELSTRLADVLEMPMSALEREAGHDESVRRAWATALALVWLRTRLREVEDVWEPIARKACHWLDVQEVGGLRAFQWLERAEELFASSGRP